MQVRLLLLLGPVIKQEENLQTSTLLSSVISLTASVAPTIPVNWTRSLC